MGDPGSGMTLAEHWNGRHWSAETTKHTGLLDGVACPATGNCTAVGSNNAGKALAAHWNGKAWSDESPADPQPLTFLQSVSCPATTACIAVGTGSTGSSTAHALTPLAEQWTGGTWTALTVPDPVPQAIWWSSTRCRASRPRTAWPWETTRTRPAPRTPPLAAQWNGTTWTIVAAPSPATFSALLSVSCTSATFCSAVGASSPTATGVVSPVAETWNGSTWSLQTAVG